MAQVIVHPLTDGDPHGLTLIGNLIDLLKAAGTHETPPRPSSAPLEPAFGLFARSVKEGPWQSPWPYTA